MEQSHASVENATTKLHGGTKQRKNPLTEIFKIINEMSRQSRDHSCKRADVVMRAFGRNYQEAQVDECIQEYEALGVWQYNSGNQAIRITIHDD